MNHNTDPPPNAPSGWHDWPPWHQHFWSLPGTQIPKDSTLAKSTILHEIAVRLRDGSEGVVLNVFNASCQVRRQSDVLVIPCTDIVGIIERNDPTFDPAAYMRDLQLRAWEHLLNQWHSELKKLDEDPRSITPPQAPEADKIFIRATNGGLYSRGPHAVHDIKSDGTLVLRNGATIDSGDVLPINVLRHKKRL